MRAYVGGVDQTGLQWFLLEDVIPTDLLRHYVREWFTRSRTAVWTLVDDEDAETIRANLTTGHHQDACNLLLNRAVELLTLATAAPDLACGVTPSDYGLCSPGATIPHQFVEDHIAGDQILAERSHYHFVDVFSGKVFATPECFKARRKDVEAVCWSIKTWNTVLPRD